MLWNLADIGNPILAIIVFTLTFGSLVVCLSVHEFAHAWMSNRLGDPTAKALGRLTLNPLAHLDPIGTLALIFFGFGWGKPVPYNPQYFAHPKQGSALVSLAGPACNLIFAVIFALCFRVLGLVGPLGEFFVPVMYILVYLNLALCFFNLIPVHPLDGFRVVWGVLPDHLAYQWNQLAPYGMYILIGMIFTRLTSVLVGVPVGLLLKILLG